MRNLKEIFKNKVNFVKPLYKKVASKPKILVNREFVTIDIDTQEKLCGHDHGVKIKRKLENKKKLNTEVLRENSFDKCNIVLPGTCQSHVKTDINIRSNVLRNEEVKGVKQTHTRMIGVVESKVSTKLPDTWLRVYPSPKRRRESASSVIFRAVVCQVGLAVFLFFWTLVWVLVINCFEEPNEKQASLEFKNSQNQLVIDLATALRQITPLSPKWRRAIEKQIEKESQLTLAAVARGARLQPGQFWDPAGCFLFTVYVMTTLGFGAPVPQTTYGRSSTLVYAIVAVPTHFFLMIHLSKCIVVHVNYCITRHRLGRNSDNKNGLYYLGFYASYKKTVIMDDKEYIDLNSLNSSSRNSELKPKMSKLRKRIKRILGVICIGRGVPCAMVLYYVLGLACFGIARSKQPLEAVMFPLEFTTSGGLDQVEDYVRVLYGFYVEGAMLLLSCVLATLRRQSSNTLIGIADRYRLFTREKL